MTTDWKRLLKAVAPNARADLVAAFVAADENITAAEITTPARIAHFIAQTATESGGFTQIEENLNYSAQRLMAVWPKRFPTLASTKGYAKNPKALAEKVYGGRMGNVKPGDGWRYRGGGILQNTGRSGYRAAGFENDPERLRTPAGALSAALTYWTDHGCNAYADRDDVTGLTKVINGGFNGLAERKHYLAKAKAAIRTLPAQAKLKALRYPVGAVDGDHGARTTGAVAAFQAKAGIPVTGDLDETTLAQLDAADEPIKRAAKDDDLAKSRTIQGAGAAGTFGLAELVQSAGELKDQLNDAQTHISTGSLFGLAIGLVVVAGALYAIYARWDDAHRPLPDFIVRRFPGLVGGLAR